MSTPSPDRHKKSIHASPGRLDVTLNKWGEYVYKDTKLSITNKPIKLNQLLVDNDVKRTLPEDDVPSRARQTIWCVIRHYFFLFW